MFLIRRASACLCGLLLILLPNAFAIRFDSEEPHTTMEMLCWQDVKCHTNHTGAMHDILFPDLQRTAPTALERDLVVDCARCKRTDMNLTCYRIATRIEHTFMSNHGLAILGEAELGAAPSTACGDSLGYCWANTSCGNDTARLHKELSANLLESPTLDMTCSSCPSQEYNISCFNTTCMSCFYDDNLHRTLYEGAELWGRAATHGQSCEDVEYFLKNPVGSHATRAVQMYLVFAGTLAAMLGPHLPGLWH
eukprot:jgi/Tetstr1/421335/TSEL_012306.t1